MKLVFHNTQREVISQKEFLKLKHRDKSAKMAEWLFFAKKPFWHFCPCASISKILFAKLRSFDPPIFIPHQQSAFHMKAVVFTGCLIL